MAKQDEYEDDPDAPKPGFLRTAAPLMVAGGLLFGGAGKIACDATDGARAPKPIVKKPERFLGPPELMRHRNELDGVPFPRGIIEDKIEREKLIMHLRGILAYFEKDLAEFAQEMKDRNIQQSITENFDYDSFKPTIEITNKLIDGLGTGHLTPETLEKGIKTVNSWSNTPPQFRFVYADTLKEYPPDRQSHYLSRADHFMKHLTEAEPLLNALRDKQPQRAP